MNTKNYLTHTKKYKAIISSLHTIYRLINSTFEIKDFLVRLTKLFCQIIKADSGSIVIIEPNKDYALYRTKVDKKHSIIIEKKTKIKNRLEKRIIKKSSFLHMKNLLAVPLIAEDLIGIVILKKKEDEFNDFDHEIIMTISAQAVLALKNLELYQEQQRIITGTIKSILTLINSRFPTSTHSGCFLKIVDEIADRMHLDEESRQSLKYASMLHDMGKIDVPYEILVKSTTLTGEEFKVIKQHPTKGAEIIKHLKILKPAVPIILHHHERYDGKGYPSQLKGNRIPLGSRIMAVADAFDAMVFGRPYRQKISIDTAVKEIKRNSGSQFDPKVVNEFLKAISSKKIKKSLKKI
ncbi:MAG: HD domain-containing protein [Candidatus Omnitrophica bacterium]|nr:HD domain-containing protein [Candidatus Omnitrophota bacterium]MDD5352287.1 HD domain-containing protein [Candidatus Omnitrophota bacterium]MDD5549885.1 HD domain-containing protein [Candidatus Omnitrophota bacterium]